MSARSIIVLCLIAITIAVFSSDRHQPKQNHAIATAVPATELPEMRLERLLEQHPVPEVRLQFADLIRHGDIAVGDASGPHDVAEFTFIASGKAPSGRSDQYGNVPILPISWPLLEGQARSDAWWTLVLYHEYVHFIQYRDGRLPMETFELVNITGPDVPEKQCTLKWYAEEEAYHKECALAVELGSAGELNGLCRAMNDTEQFRRDLNQALAHNPGPCQAFYRAKVVTL